MEKEQEKIGVINFDKGFKKQRIPPSCTLYENGVPNRKNWKEEQAKRIKAAREAEQAKKESSPETE
jgi:hypothetical protein